MSNRLRAWSIGRNRSGTHLLQDQIADAMRGVEGLETTITNAVRAIEDHGCSTEFLCQRPGTETKQGSALEVLSLDLVWLSSGPYGSWSEDGRQACYCIRNGSSGAAESHPVWYQTVLNRFFSTNNCRSLLTYPDIYTRPLFLEISELDDDVLPCAAGDNKLGSSFAGSHHEVWESSFSPDPHADQSVEEWGQRFKHFRTLLREELQVEFGHDAASDAILAWIYVSAGTSRPDNIPPPWAASMFLLFRFSEPRKADCAVSPIERDLDLLLSNLSHALQAASQRTLPGPAKHDIAQALAHEFKNLNQDIAVLSELVLSDFMNVSPQVRSRDLDTVRERLHALHLAAQASTAFSTAAYWLACPTWNDVELRPDDGRCSIFTHIVYLAIRLIAETRGNWTLIGVPEIDPIASFLDEHLNLNSGGSVTRLVSNRCISIMLFFALEPVRNIRSNRTGVEVSVETGSGKVVLQQRTTEVGRSQKRSRSATIIALMQIARDNPRLAHFIYIDPEVSSDVESTPEPNVFVVRRRTTIFVDQVPYPKY